MFTRNYCSLDDSLQQQLSDDINYVYEDSTSSKMLRKIYPFKLASIQQQILLCHYVLSPLQVKFIKKIDFITFYTKICRDFPDIEIAKCKDLNYYAITMPSTTEDVMVLMGLSRMLLRLTYVKLPCDGYRIIELEDSYHSSINKIGKTGKIERVYKLDLYYSKTILPHRFILDTIKQLEMVL